MAEKTLNENNVKTMLNKVKTYTDAELSTKQNTLTFDTTPTQNSGNPITSGGVYTAVQNVTEVAEGKTASYTISDVTNASFNSSNDTITLAVSGTITDIQGNTINLSDLRIGDIVLITETDVPDRWVGSKDSTNVVFYKMETTKVDLSNYIDLSTNDQTFAGDKVLQMASNAGYLEISKTSAKGIRLYGNSSSGITSPTIIISDDWVNGNYRMRLTPYSIIRGNHTYNFSSTSAGTSTLATTDDIPAQDSTPTADSTNNVTSGGVCSALRLKQENLYSHNIYMHIDANNSYASFTITNTNSNAMTASDIADYFNNVVPAGGTISCNGYLRITQGHVTAGHDFVYRIGGTAGDSTIFTVYTLTTVGAQAAISNSTDTLYTAYTYDDTVIPLNPNPTPALPTISFTIAGTSYTADSGMTWGQWVLSAYSNNEWADDGNIYNIDNTRYVQDANSTLVLSSDTITANATYTLSGGGGD